MAALFLNPALRKRIDRVPALQRGRWRMEAGLLALFWWFSARFDPETASDASARAERRWSAAQSSDEAVDPGSG